MSDSRVMGSLDRLPWLADEPVRRSEPANRRSSNLIGWAAAAIALVAAVAFWLGTRTPTQDALPSTARPSATVAVPPPRPAPASEARAAPQSQAAPVEAPQIRVVRVPEIRIVPVPAAKPPTAPQVSATPEPAAAASVESEKTVATQEAAPKAPAQLQLRPWQPRVVAAWTAKPPQPVPISTTWCSGPSASFSHTSSSFAIEAS